MKITADSFLIFIKHNFYTYGDLSNSKTVQDKLPKNERNYTNSLFKYKSVSLMQSWIPPSPKTSIGLTKTP